MMQVIGKNRLLLGQSLLRLVGLTIITGALVFIVGIAALDGAAESIASFAAGGIVGLVPAELLAFQNILGADSKDSKDANDPASE